MGMQTVAFGGKKPAPFNQIIAQSQVLEGGITGNFTQDAWKRLTNATTCNTTDVQSTSTVKCLRVLSMADLLQAQLDTYSSGPAANIGDEWLPVVDGDVSVRFHEIVIDVDVSLVPPRCTLRAPCHRSALQRHDNDWLV